jgi:hypothetical protein
MKSGPVPITHSPDVQDGMMSEDPVTFELRLENLQRAAPPEDGARVHFCQFLVVGSRI